MKNTRLKSTGPLLKTRDQMESAVGQIRELTIERMSLSAELEAQRKALDEEYGPQLTDIDRDLSELTERVKSWAEANPDDFGKARSLETVHGKIGWRMGNWKCEKLAGWLWERTKKTASGARVVLEKLKSLPAMSDYIRHKEEVDKDRIIADRGVLTAEALSTIGVAVVQEESFFVEPKIEQTENRQTAV